MNAEGSAPGEPLILRAGAARCGIRAAIGGSLSSWTIGDQPMLRPGTADAADPRALASFPLVPYSNRIGQARFGWGGATVQLARSAAADPHALHGVGWQRPWTIADHGDDHATLSLTHGGDADWPWPFEATQRIMLRADGLSIALHAVNRHHAPVPLGFGHHPYFDTVGATLRFTARQMFPPGDDALPLDPVPPRGSSDFSAGAAVTGRSIDTCFAGWDGNAYISWADRPLGLAITASATLPALVVYIPAGGDAFCVEPVPNISNALNRPDAALGLPVIDPGAAFTAEIHLSAVAR